VSDAEATLTAPPPGEFLPPPSSAIGRRAWLRQNLFSGPWSSVLTILMGLVLGWVALSLGDWVVNEARWGVVTENLRLYLVGRYPVEEQYRIWLSLTILSVLSGLSAAVFGAATRTLGIWLAAGQALLAGLAFISGLGIVIVLALLLNAALVWAALFIALRWPVPRRPLLIAWFLSVPISLLLLSGLQGSPLEAVSEPLGVALPTVSTNVWEGLLLTFILAIAGITLSFPLGVLLALGRRSTMPAVKLLSTVYIETIRGVPLVTILFMADIMLPLFLPGEWRLDRVLRAMGGITLFSAAYVAENVRGGLQAIPSGQIEAANAIGLNTIQTNVFIVLPQALRSVIPANVGLFISLLKDTTLVTIVGLVEILNIGRAVLANPEWFGAQLEVYVFVAAVFFLMCYTMSQASYRLEASMGVGTR